MQNSTFQTAEFSVSAIPYSPKPIAEFHKSCCRIPQLIGRIPQFSNIQISFYIEDNIRFIGPNTYKNSSKYPIIYTRM